MKREFLDLWVAAASALGMLYFMQDRFLFGRSKVPIDIPLGPYADAVKITTHEMAGVGGARLHGWSCGNTPLDAPNKVLLYFGGRYENVAWASRLATYLSGWTVYSFNYRSSTGTSSEATVKADALLIFDYIAAHQGGRPADFAIMGRGLGTAVAMTLASEVNAPRLVLLSPFQSLRSALTSSRWLSFLVPFVKAKFECLGVARSLSSRTLVLLAQNDTVVRPHESLKVADAMANAPMVVTIAQADHRSLARHRDVHCTLAAFLSID